MSFCFKIRGMDCAEEVGVLNRAMAPLVLSVTKPLTFGITVVSIAVGYVWMMKRTPKVFEKHVNNRLHEDAGAEPGQV